MKLFHVFLFLSSFLIAFSAFSNDDCESLIKKIDTNLKQNQLSEETKKEIIELRASGIEANKNPAFSESMGIYCKNILKEAQL